MKNFKTFICIAICLVASFAVLLLSPFTINAFAGVEDAGKSYAQNTQTRFLTINNNKTVLFDDHIENLYTISSCNNSTSGGNSGDISYDKNNKSIKFTTSSNAIDKKNPRIETAFKLNGKYKRAVEKGLITVTLKVKVENKNASTEIGFQEGTINTNGGDGFSGWNSKNGSYATVKDLGSLQKEGDNYVLSFVPTTTDILLVFANNKSGGGINTNELTITNPTIELTRNASPTINISDLLVNGKVSDSSWTAQAKTLTFNVSDNNFGIDYVTINGEKVECDENSINNDTLKTYSYLVNSIAETNYTITAYDYLGGTTSVSKKVGFVDSQDVSDVTINAENSYHEKNITIDISFEEDTTHSHDSVYYTLIDNSTGEDPTPNPNDTTGKTKEVPHQNGRYTFNFSFEFDGEYTLTILICDEAGHQKTFSKTFTIDSVKRRVNVTSHNGTYNITGVYSDEQGYYTWNGESITLTYNANENFNFYKLLRNGSEMQTNGSVYNYTCKDADINIEIFNRFVVDLNAVESYEFSEDGTNLIYSLNSNYLVNVLSREELSNILQENLDGLTEEEILQKVDSLINSNLILTIKTNGFVADSIYNVGSYFVSYKIDTPNFTGSNSFNILVTPKILQVEFLENNFTYNGKVQNVNFVQIPNQTVNVKYYSVLEDGSVSSTETSLLNAGTYKAVLTLNNANYTLSNGEIILTINKKQVEVKVENTTFKYNANNQNIIYSLTEDIDCVVNYFNNDGNLVNSFKNAGEYSYSVLPLDEVNYEFINNSGKCTILKITANIQVNKIVYDYTGNALTLIYSVTDENGEEVIVNNLTITYFVNGEVANFIEPNNYSFSFDTIDRDNYILGGTLTGTATIKKTKIFVFVSNTEYEYTGSEIKLNYYFLNEENEKLDALNNISLEFIKNGQVTNFIDCGEYEYNFVTSDVNYEIIFNNKTSLTIVPAVLNVQVLNNTYTYNSLGNLLNYVILSNNNVNFTDNENIILSITKNGETASLLNVGIYEYSFISNNQNIILNSGDITGTIEITSKLVYLQNVVDSYSYTGEELIFNYTLSENIAVNVEIDTLINAGSYNYIVTACDSNYEIVNGTGSVVVTPKSIQVLNISTNYTYTGNNVEVTFDLEEDIETYVTFKNANNQNEELLNNIVNAGNYNIFITPINQNYVVDSSNIIITINAKQVEINVTNTTQTYNKTNKQISVEVENNVPYVVTYYNEKGEEVKNTTNAGTYNFVVSLTNSNYIANCTGTLVVEKLNAYLTVVADQYKVYGDVNEENYAYALNGVVEGDVIDVVLTRNAGEAVGYYQINLQSYNNPNYNLIYSPVNFKIIAKKLIIVANNVTKTYESLDEELTYKITFGELVNNDVLLGNLEREEGEDVGVYNINIGTLQTLNPNYQIIFKKANFTIIPSDLKIKINNIETTYGTEVALSFSAERSFNETMVTGEIAREEGFDAGTYLITKGTLQSKNYNLIITNGTYTINPKSAFVTAQNLTKTYGEEDNLNYTVIGLLNNDVLKGALGRETGEDAGTYLINLGTLQTLNPNYLFNLQEAYYTINKAILTVNIANQTQVYGEEEKELTYTINGLKFNDEINFKLFRESGLDVGEYQIACGIPQLNNYYVLLNSGKYTITKAKISPVLVAETSTYNGKAQNFTNTNFPYELEYTYKLNGIQVDSVINAGTYLVQGYFAGNNNYEPAKSNAVTFTINKVSVCFNLGNNNFVYDGEVKSPYFSFDSSLGLSSNAITFEFENNAIPREVGSYPFTILVNDDNYTGFASGVLNITKPVTIVGDDSIIECEDAVFDSTISNLKLVSHVFNGKFNNQQVLQACTFENTSGIDESHIFTVRMRAKTSDSNVYVYKIDKNNVASEVVVSVQDGYYVFKVDGLDCQYIITKDIEPMSLITIAVIIAVSIIVLVAIVIAFKVRKNRKKKLALKMANNNATISLETVTTENNNLNDKNKKNKKVRVDNVISSALNNGTVNTNVESILDANKKTSETCLDEKNKNDDLNNNNIK